MTFGTTLVIWGPVLIFSMVDVGKLCQNWAQSVRDCLNWRMKVLWSFELSWTAHPMTPCHIPEDMNLHSILVEIQTVNLPNAMRSHLVSVWCMKSYVWCAEDCFERLEQFKYLGTTSTNQNSIQKEIKSRLKLGNACYHLQNLLSSSLLSKNLKIKIYRTIILTCCFVWIWNLVTDIEGRT